MKTQKDGVRLREQQPCATAQRTHFSGYFPKFKVQSTDEETRDQTQGCGGES